MRERDGSSRLRGLALLLLLVCGLARPGRAGFIFTDEPLARLSPALGETDLFGYAAALHRVQESSDPQDFSHAISNTKIIVGAPNGTFPGGLTLPGVDASEALNHTGLVYVCPITPGDCEALTGNGTGNDIRLFDYEGNSINMLVSLQDEVKTGQFMGATITSSGEHLMVCAPRWISLDIRGGGFFDTTRGHGRCFISGRDMRNFELLRPCVGGTPSSEGGESYCMSGTSAALYEETNTTVLSFLGSPPFSSSRGMWYT
jgi:hypothetical protein